MDDTWFDEVPGTRFSRVQWVAEIGSTNTELLAAGRAGAAEGTVLIADLQTAGRGRRGRSWTAPPGTSLMMSVLLRPDPARLEPRHASLVTMALAVAASEAVEAQTGLLVGVKWPNDLVVDVADADRIDGDQGYRKLAGILTESVISGGRIDALVPGMGMNTGWGEVPAELAGVATSLDILAGRPIDRPQLAAAILTQFEHRYVTLLTPRGIGVTLDAVRGRSATLGRGVRVELESGQLEGLAVDLDGEGHLVVEDLSGRSHTLTVGDVVHLRPGGR